MVLTDPTETLLIPTVQLIHGALAFSCAFLVLARESCTHPAHPDRRCALMLDGSARIEGQEFCITWWYVYRFGHLQRRHDWVEKYHPLMALPLQMLERRGDGVGWGCWVPWLSLPFQTGTKRQRCRWVLSGDPA
jgi:hypothetical protein